MADAIYESCITINIKLTLYHLCFYKNAFLLKKEGLEETNMFFLNDIIYRSTHWQKITNGYFLVQSSIFIRNCNEGIRC